MPKTYQLSREVYNFRAEKFKMVVFLEFYQRINQIFHKPTNLLG